MIILLGDIGGTNARLAYSVLGEPSLHKIKIFECKKFSSIFDLLDKYCSSVSIVPDALSLAVAAPILNDKIKLTNNDWQFSKKALQKSFRFKNFLVTNDFTAQAYAQIPFFSGNYPIKKWFAGSNEPIAELVSGTYSHDPILIVGPGTGLGLATLIMQNSIPIIVQGEGGHVHFSPRSEIELDLYAWFREQKKCVTAETLVSGRGLEEIFNFLSIGKPKLTETEANQKLAKEIGESALVGDTKCLEAVNIMFGVLGTVVANAVLTTGSWGGVVLGGGIIPKLVSLLEMSPFLKNFLTHDTHYELLNDVPIFIFSDPYGGVRGAQIAFSKKFSSKQTDEETRNE